MLQLLSHVYNDDTDTSMTIGQLVFTKLGASNSKVNICENPYVWFCSEGSLYCVPFTEYVEWRMIHRLAFGVDVCFPPSNQIKYKPTEITLHKQDHIKTYIQATQPNAVASWDVLAVKFLATKIINEFTHYKQPWIDIWFTQTPAEVPGMIGKKRLHPEVVQHMKHYWIKEGYVFMEYRQGRGNDVEYDSIPIPIEISTKILTKYK